jgi:hypothetical protein
MTRAHLWIALGLGLALAGCRSSLDKEKQRFAAARDRLDAAAAQMPDRGDDIRARLAVFAREEKWAESLKGDDAIKALEALVNRMDDYEKSLGPPAAPATPGSGAASGAAPPLPPSKD